MFPGLSQGPVAFCLDLPAQSKLAFLLPEIHVPLLTLTPLSFSSVPNVYDVFLHHHPAPDSARWDPLVHDIRTDTSLSWVIQRSTSSLQIMLKHITCRRTWKTTPSHNTKDRGDLETPLPMERLNLSIHKRGTWSPSKAYWPKSHGSIVMELE